MSQAQLDVGDAGAQSVLPAARVRRQEGAAVDSVLRLGLRARIADHHRPQGRQRCDAADRRAGPRAFLAGLLDRHLSGGHADPRRHARASTRPAARGSRIELHAPILPVAHNAGYLWPKGLFGKRPGTVTMSFGKPIAPAGKDVPTLNARSRNVDRGRGRAARRSRRAAKTAALRRQATSSAAARRDATRPRRRESAAIVLAGAASITGSSARAGARSACRSTSRSHRSRAALGDDSRDRRRR